MRGGRRISETVYNADGSIHTLKRAVGSGQEQITASYSYTAQGQLGSLTHDLAGSETDLGYSYTYNQTGQ